MAAIAVHGASQWHGRAADNCMNQPAFSGPPLLQDTPFTLMAVFNVRQIPCESFFPTGRNSSELVREPYDVIDGSTRQIVISDRVINELVQQLTINGH